VLHRLRQNSEAVGQNLPLYVAWLVNHRFSAGMPGNWAVLHLQL
jgi:hypothetical protein